MEKLQTKVLEYKNELIIGLISLLLGGLLIYLIFNINKEETIIPNEVTIKSEEMALETFFVDIKGEVKNPGVYHVDSEILVNDLIKLAGGLTKNGTTQNINLSQGLKKSMVIIVPNKKKTKITEITLTNSCTCNEVDITPCIVNNEPIVATSEEVNDLVDNSKISINNASKEELMNISGIGESKALNIINYREINGLFKTIEDIKNVSGIGEILFAQIKESITL